MNQYDKAVMDGKPEDWLITDVRFKDEADSVNGRSGTLIRVTRILILRRIISQNWT